MQNDSSLEIIDRFWTAFEVLSKHHGRGWAEEFIHVSGFDSGNFYRLRRERRREFEVSLLGYIVGYGINAHWLITGRGRITPKLIKTPSKVTTSVTTQI